MIDALLHGKLSRRQENMEDLLTSVVFGSFKHLDPAYLGRFLSLARAPDGGFPLQSLAHATAATSDFWPWLAQPGCFACEPDVLVTGRDEAGAPFHVLVEAKFRSGKSSFADDRGPADEEEGDAAADELPANDQLAREWENLAAAYGPDAWLVYLTADAAMPRADLAAAQAELRHKGKSAGHLAWLSWRDLQVAFPGECPTLLEDLLKLLERLMLLPFRGIRVPMLPVPSWRFDYRGPHGPVQAGAPSARTEFRFAYPSTLPRWSFAVRRQFPWGQPIDAASAWRFRP